MASAFHPSDYIRDELKARGWTVEQFAIMANIRREVADEIVNSRVRLSMLRARCVAQAFGTSWELWWKLQQAYDMEANAQT